MNEYLKIENFGPIKEVELENIRPLTIFIGESGSGKSTIMKVLSMFRWLYKQYCIRSFFKQSGISKSPFRLNVLSCLTSSGIQDYVRKDTHLLYVNGSKQIEIYTGKNGQPNMRDEGVIPENELCLEKVCFITEKRNAIADIIAGRSKEKQAGYYLKELLDETLDARQFIKEVELAAVGVKVVEKKVAGIEQLFIESMNDEGAFSIHLEDASSGIQSLAPLGLLLSYYDKYFDLVKSWNSSLLKYLMSNDRLSDFRPTQNVGGINRKRVDLHIEEPEMCLYPSNQLEIMNSLISIVKNQDRAYQVGVVMTTHSPYLVNYLNLLVKRADKGLSETASLAIDNIDVYQIVDGQSFSLKCDGNLFNATSLSDTISEIYNEYNQL